MTSERDVLKWHAELDTTDVEPHPAFSLYRDSTALLVIDVQERLGAAMKPEVFERVVRNTVILIEVAKRMNLPILVTEQYPKGLGPTVQAVKDALPEDVIPVEKMDFSCGHLPSVRDVLRRGERRQVVVCGQETHVCVFQSVRWLVEHGWFVHVARDAVCSRTEESWKAGLELMAGLGATLTTTETVAFDLVKTAEHEAFKEISRLVK